MRYQLYVFGSNGEGQLGTPAEEIVSTPVIAESWPSEHRIRAVRSGDNHTLFLTESGSIFCAGSNRKNQLGTTGSSIEKAGRLHHAVSLFAATCESSAYITNAGGSHSTLQTEGVSHWGELGLGAISSTNGLPDHELSQQLPHSVVDFAAGGWHYVAILSNGQIFGWGKSRLDQLGPKLASNQRVSRPKSIEDDLAFTPISVVCGKEFTYLAGDPSSGQHFLFGRDKFLLRSSMPAHIKGWKQIGATWNAIFVLFEDGRLIAWGKDDMWKLIPEHLPLIERIAVGSEHVLAVTQQGNLISWGWGKHGNCGDLTKLGERVKNDMVNGIWNEIELPGKISFIGAGFCTSFVAVEMPLET